MPEWSGHYVRKRTSVKPDSRKFAALYRCCTDRLGVIPLKAYSAEDASERVSARLRSRDALERSNRLRVEFVEMSGQGDECLGGGKRVAVGVVRAVDG